MAYTVEIVFIVDMVCIVDTVDTVYTVYTVYTHDDLSSRSQLLIEAFEILNIYFASTFAMRPYQALTTKSQQDRQFV